MSSRYHPCNGAPPMRIGCKRFICTGVTIWVTMLLLKTHHDNMGSHMVAFTSVTAWIDSPFLAQVTYTCVSISAGGHAPCSAPYSRREPLVDPENSAAPPLQLDAHPVHVTLTGATVLVATRAPQPPFASRTLLALSAIGGSSKMQAEAA